MSCFKKGYIADAVFPVPIVPVINIFWKRPFSEIYTFCECEFVPINRESSEEYSVSWICGGECEWWNFKERIDIIEKKEILEKIKYVILIKFHMLGNLLKFLINIKRMKCIWKNKIIRKKNIFEE